MKKLKNPIVLAHALACAGVIAVLAFASPAKAADLMGFSTAASGGLAATTAFNGSSWAQALGNNSAYSTAFRNAENANTTAGSTGSATGSVNGQAALANAMNAGMALGTIQTEPLQARDVMANSYFALPGLNIMVTGN